MVFDTPDRIVTLLVRSDGKIDLALVHLKVVQIAMPILHHIQEADFHLELSIRYDRTAVKRGLLIWYTRRFCHHRAELMPRLTSLISRPPNRTIIRKR